MKKIDEETWEITKKISKLKNVEAVYIFGGYANGKVHFGSDIDICIIGNLTKKDKENIRGLSIPDNYDISFFNELPIWIKMRIFSGKLLFCRNKEFVYGACFKTLKEYSDFKPAINRFCKETLCMT